MNLKDNRTCSSIKNSEKFRFCRKNKVVGIGWAEYDEDKISDIGFKKADNAIKQFNCGDLVWVRDIESDVYYICEITESVKKREEYDYKSHDLGKCCKCEFFRVGQKLPDNIIRSDLVSRSTIQRANEEVACKTIDLFKKLKKRNNAISLLGVVLLLITPVILYIISSGHKHDMAEKVITKATCTEKGIIKYYCNNCEYTYEEETEPLGHNYDGGKVIVDRTCTTDGKKECVCKVCGIKNVVTIPAGHSFTGNVCVDCNATKSDLVADSWYHYIDIPYLNCQNCIITTASALSSSVLVSFYPVCRNCHIVSAHAQYAAPGYNYDVTKNYVCPDCGSTTRIKLKLSN